MTNCNECAQNEILENACLGILSKFQDDLIEFAKYNWAPSHVDMLERAIECVCKGERAYPNEEESEEWEKVRLIDADELLILEAAAYVKAQAKTSDKITRLVNQVVHKKLQMLVSDAPTAYDVDKVVEQLENKVKEYDERIEKRKGATFFDETERIKQFDERARGVEIAIEIVKGGGLDGNTNT